MRTVASLVGPTGCIRRVVSVATLLTIVALRLTAVALRLLPIALRLAVALLLTALLVVALVTTVALLTAVALLTVALLLITLLAVALLVGVACRECRSHHGHASRRWRRGFRRFDRCRCGCSRARRALRLEDLYQVPLELELLSLDAQLHEICLDLHSILCLQHDPDPVRSRRL